MVAHATARSRLRMERGRVARADERPDIADFRELRQRAVKWTKNAQTTDVAPWALGPFHFDGLLTYRPSGLEAPHPHRHYGAIGKSAGSNWVSNRCACSI